MHIIKPSHRLGANLYADTGGQKREPRRTF